MDLGMSIYVRVGILGDDVQGLVSAMCVCVWLNQMVPSSA